MSAGIAWGGSENVLGFRHHHTGARRSCAAGPLHRHQDHPPGLQLHGRALRPLHEDADARPQPDHPVRRPRRRQDEHDGAGARRADPGDHHQGQRDRRGRRRRLLPGAERAAGGLPGRRAAERHPQPDHDQHPHGHGLDGSRRTPVQPRSRSTSGCCASSTKRRIPGASRSPASRSRTSTRRRTWSNRWAAR